MSDPDELSRKWTRVNGLLESFREIQDGGEVSVDPDIRNFVDSLSSELVRMTTEITAITNDQNEKSRHISHLSDALQNQNDVLKQQMDVLTSLTKSQDLGTETVRENRLNPSSTMIRGHRRVHSQHAVEEIKVAQEAQRRVAEEWEIDMKEFFLFVDWQNGRYLRNHDFLQGIVDSDVRPALDFGTGSREHSEIILEEIMSRGAVALEPIGQEGDGFECRLCPGAIAQYKLSISSQGALYVSRLVRNRIAAVCEMFHYIMFLRMQLPEYNKMKSRAIFLKIQKYRFAITLSRLGLSSDSQ